MASFGRRRRVALWISFRPSVPPSCSPSTAWRQGRRPGAGRFGFAWPSGRRSQSPWSCCGRSRSRCSSWWVSAFPPRPGRRLPVALPLRSLPLLPRLACRRARWWRPASSSRTTRTGSSPGRGSPRLLRCGSSCRPGDRVLAPPDIGLYVHGLTSCRRFRCPRGCARLRRASRGDARLLWEASPAARAGLADRQHITHLVLPGYAGPRPAGWLGEDTPFRAMAQVGRGPGSSRSTPAPGRKGPRRAPRATSG